MNSEVSKAARNYRLQEWTQMIQECNSRPVGMTIDEWCEDHSITKANYYYRLRQVRKACLDEYPELFQEQTVVSVPTELMTLQDEPVQSQVSEESYLELTSHGITLRVTEQTSTALLSKVLGVLAHVE